LKHEILAEGIEIYNADCLDVMREMEDGSVDAVITDPPYGIGFKYNNHDDTPVGYGEWLWQVLELAENKAKDGSIVFVFQAMPNVKEFTKWFPREWRIFAACKNFVQMRKIEMQYAFDPCVVWWKEGERYSEGTLNRDWHIGNTANTLNRKDGDGKGHPCPRPLDQMEHIVNQWVKPGGVVLDPFMGSGTTGIVCHKTGRKFIGIEIDELYYNIAKRRIQETLMQPRLEFG
jgi:site-specific DNA-methyltransferase (adenine-specific)